MNDSIIAWVEGVPMTETPSDLFIPPDALEVLLETFTGPLDLLLYLIRRQNINLLDIPMVLITEQYMQYIEKMDVYRLELAADYLLMAAVLAEIKSRLLLPKLETADDAEEVDPRLALVQQLLVYEQFKAAAEALDALPRRDRDVFSVRAEAHAFEAMVRHPDVDLMDVVDSFIQLMKQHAHEVNHVIHSEVLSVRERMQAILKRLESGQVYSFIQCLSFEENRLGLTVTLLAVLELAKQSLVVLTQVEPMSVIYVAGVSHA
jgi:segregation and condensation protein A